MQNGNGTSSPATSPYGSPSSALARAEHFEQEAVLIEREEQHLDQEKMIGWMLDKSDPKQKKLQCESFLLFHDHKTQGLIAVSTGATIPKKNVTLEERTDLIRQIVEEFAEESEQRAQRFAPDLQGFQVSAYTKEGVNDDPESKGQDPTFTRYFNVTPAGSLTQPNYQGNSTSNTDVDVVQIVGQLQRDKDVTLKQLTNYIGSTQERIIDWNSKVMTENRLLSDLAFEQSRKMEALLDDRARRDAEAIEKKMHIDAQWQLIQGGLAIGKGLFERYMASKMMPLPQTQDALPEGASAPAAAVPNPLEDLGSHLSPEELVTIVAALSDENQDRFKPIAMAIVAKMAPNRQQMVGALLLRLQEERAKASAQAEIKVTVSPPPAAAPTPAPKAPASKATKKEGAK